MEKFNYVVALVAVITGLGLSDVTISLHRLMKRRAGVTWDWIPVGLGLYLGLALMRLWYQLWGVRAFDGVTDLPFVTAQVVQTLVLVLVASAALPDEDDFHGGSINLREYYDRHGKYIWTMYLVFEALWLATGVYFWARHPDRDIFAYAVLYMVYFGIPLALTASVLATGRKWHGAILAALVVHEITVSSNFFGLVGKLLAALE
jgi:hypothetical protein